MERRGSAWGLSETDCGAVPVGRMESSLGWKTSWPTAIKWARKEFGTNQPNRGLRNGFFPQEG